MRTAIERRAHWKTAPALELRANTDGTSTLVGYAAVFNRYSQDLGGFVEQVAPGAFTKTIAERDVYGLFNHNVDAILGLTAANTLTLTEDVTGLRYEIQLDGDPVAQTVRAKVQRGELRGSSFSFRALNVEWGLTEQDMPLRTLREVALYDVGPVTFPAYLATQEEGAAAALRSLAAQIDRPVEELVAAAGRNELRSFIPGAVLPPAQHATTDLTIDRRKLDLLEIEDQARVAALGGR